MEAKQKPWDKPSNLWIFNPDKESTLHGARKISSTSAAEDKMSHYMLSGAGTVFHTTHKSTFKMRNVKIRPLNKTESEPGNRSWRGT